MTQKSHPNTIQELIKTALYLRKGLGLFGQDLTQFLGDEAKNHRDLELLRSAHADATAILDDLQDLEERYGAVFIPKSSKTIRTGVGQ